MVGTHAARPARWSPRRRADFLRGAILDALETRLLLSAAHDISGITALRADPTFSGINGAGITIAFFDSGAYADNPALSGNFIGYVNAVSPAGGVLSLTTSAATADADAEASGDGHGTHTAGIAVSTDPEIGAAPGAKFIEIRNLANPGETPTVSDEFHPGMQWVLQNATRYNIKVVNISEGDPTVNSDDPTAEARTEATLSSDILALENAGIAVVVSSGNNYAEYADGDLSDELGNSSPAIFSQIAVGNTIADTIDPTTLDQPFGGGGPDYYAVDTTLGSPDQIEATSQRDNLSNQIFAPGDNITSTWLGTGTKSESGTSMSAPLVSGIVAMMQQEAHNLSNGYLTVSVIANILQSTADTITDSTISTNFRFSAASGGDVGVLPTTGLSYKRVDAEKALQAVYNLFVIPQGQQFLSIHDPIQQLPDLNGTEAFDASGSITHPNDVYLYKVNINEVANFTLYLTAPIGGGQAFSATVRLFDSSGNQISTASGAVSASQMVTLTTDPDNPLAIGTYYIGVSSQGNNAYDPVAGTGAANGSTTGDYRLNVNIINPDPNGVVTGASSFDFSAPDGYDNFTSPGHPTPVFTAYNYFTGFLGSDPAVPGSVNTARINVDNGDVDMFSFQAPDDGVVNVQSTNTGGGESGLPWLRLFTQATDGTYVQVQTDTTFGTTSFMSYVVQLGLTYYIGVSTTANEAYDPTNPYGRPANSTPHNFPFNYDLSIYFNNGDKNGTAFDATDATIGGTITDSIGSDSGTPLYDTNTAGGFASLQNFTKDVDWYDYNITTNGELDIKVAGTGSGFTPDIQMWSYDSTAGVMTQIGDSSGNNELTLQVFSGDVIYVTISDLKNTDFHWDTVGSGSGGAVGQYSLKSTLLAASAYKTLNNNTLQNGTPTPVSPGHTIDGNIGYDGATASGTGPLLVLDASDVDLYSFRAATTGLISLSTLTQSETDANTVVRVFDASGNPLATSQSQTFSSLGGQVNINVTAGTTYLVGVSGAAFDTSNYSAVNGSDSQDGSMGHYRLAISNVILPPVAVIFTTQPLSGMSGVMFATPLTVNVVDVNNLTISGDDSMVTIKIATGPAGAVLSGTTTMQAQDGVAVFPELTFSKTGTYTLIASDMGLRTATTNPITISLAPTHLVFTQMPSVGLVAGGAFGLQVSVEDASNHVVSADQSSVTLGIFSGPNGTLIGTTTEQAQGGVAMFAGLSLTASGTYTLSAIDTGLTGAHSANLIIAADASTSRLALLHQPGDSIVGKPLVPVLVFAVEDQFGNLVTSDHSKVTLGIVSGPTNGALSGATPVTVTNGTATFSGAILSAVGTYMLAATDGTLSIATPVQYTQNIDPGATTVATPHAAASYTVGQAITLTTTMKSADPTSLAFTQGAMIVDQEGIPLATAQASATGALKFILTGITANNYFCTVVYAGDTNHASASSTTFALTIKQGTTTTSLSASVAAPVFGQAITLTAKVAGPVIVGISRTGTVTFFDGITQLGSPITLNASSSASIIVTPAAGKHSYKAVYSGDGNFKMSTSAALARTVAKDKTAIVLAPSLVSPVVHGTSLDLVATISVVLPGINVPAGTVTFKDGTHVLGTASLDTGVATLAAITFTASGTQTLTAIYSGDADDNAITSSVFKLVVT